MNKIKLIFVLLVIIVIASGVLYGIRMQVQQSDVGRIEDTQFTEEITSTSTAYISETGDEAQVTYYSNDTASLRLIGTEYMDIQFDRAISASGARYQNVQQGLVLWEKEPELRIYKNEEELFFGKKQEILAREQISKLLTETTWVWTKTLNDIGPAAQYASVTIPLQTDAFTLTFTSDGEVNGETDCNSFGGTYSLDGRNAIRFSSFMSTLMYCEGSQEEEFVSMIKDSNILIQEEELILENNQTIYFRKKQK